MSTAAELRVAAVASPRGEGVGESLAALGRLAGEGRFAECAAGARRHLGAHRGDLVASYLLGLSLYRMGRVEESLEHLAGPAGQEPPQRDCLVVHGDALFASGRELEAARQFARATRYYSNDGRAHAKLAFALMRCGYMVEAMEACMAAMRLEPGRADVVTLFATCTSALGRPEEAEAWYAKAVELEPTNKHVQGEYAFHLNYLAGVTRERVYREHLKYGALVRATSPARVEVKFDPDPNRRLRVGVLSADLGGHPVGTFMRAWFEHHDRGRSELHVYSGIPREDAVTRELRALAPRWLDVRLLSDAELAERIRADRIDVLMDLSGLTCGGRVHVMPARAAPVQMTYLGYANTTGLSEIDYRIVDEVTDPVGESDGWASERLLRVPSPFVCWTPPRETPAVADRRGATRVVFGSFNHPAKLSEATLGTWRRILERVPGSVLLIKGKGLDLDRTRGSFVRRMVERGFDPARLEVRGFTAETREHLGVYGDVDIALDPFPYNGTTTTCEAMWMGVPVVTLAGDRHAARVGVSLLGAAGLGALVARDEDGYVAIAAALAADRGALAAMRSSLRERMRASALCDGARFARGLDAAMRAAWRKYVATRPYSAAA